MIIGRFKEKKKKKKKAGLSSNYSILSFLNQAAISGVTWPFPSLQQVLQGSLLILAGLSANSVTSKTTRTTSGPACSWPLRTMRTTSGPIRKWEWTHPICRFVEGACVMTELDCGDGMACWITTLVSWFGILVFVSWWDPGPAIAPPTVLCMEIFCEKKVNGKW